MAPEQQRKFNTIAGSLFTIGALVFLGMTVNYVLRDAPAKPTPVTGASYVPVNSCVDTLRAMRDFSVNPADNSSTEVYVKGPLMKGSSEREAELYMDKISLATTVCKYKLKEFCIGFACVDNEEGFYFKLEVPAALREKQKAKKPETSAADADKKPAIPNPGATKASGAGALKPDELKTTQIN